MLQNLDEGWNLTPVSNRRHSRAKHITGNNCKSSFLEDDFTPSSSVTNNTTTKIVNVLNTTFKQDCSTKKKGDGKTYANKPLILASEQSFTTPSENLVSPRQYILNDHQ